MKKPCMAFAFLLIFAGLELAASPVVAFIGGEAVTRDELQYWEKRLRVTDLVAHQNTAASRQFRRHKVLMGLFRKHGLIEDASHASLLRQQRAENGRRKRAKADDRVVYGPVFLHTDAYLDYLTSRLEAELMRVLQKQWPLPTEVELRNLHERYRVDFRKPDELHIEVITIAANTIGINHRQMIFGDMRPISEGETEEAFFQAVQVIKEGQLTVLEEAVDETTLIYCSKRTGGEYRHLDDVRPQLSFMHFEQVYAAFLQGLLDDKTGSGA